MDKLTTQTPSPASDGSAAFAWQPIETLPRDGTPVLVWAEPMHAPDIAWHEETGGTLRAYTHWMALPKPPNVESEDNTVICERCNGYGWTVGRNEHEWETFQEQCETCYGAGGVEKAKPQPNDQALRSVPTAEVERKKDSRT